MPVPVEIMDARDVDNPHHGVYLKYLYDVLKERLQEPLTNISHTKLPSWEDHVSFVLERSHYIHHYVIVNRDLPTDCMGVLYCTENNELGIYISMSYRRRGLATYVLDYFLYSCPGTYTAHINPANISSQVFFIKSGFTPLQYTYTRHVPDDDELLGRDTDTV
jgi:hypothetical protein